jgi:hypothetical protein
VPHCCDRVECRWCPEDEAGWGSRLLFSFVSSLMSKGQHLDQQDLWDTSRQDEPEVVWGEFKQHLEATAKPSAPEVGGCPGGGGGSRCGGGFDGGGGEEGVCARTWQRWLCHCHLWLAALSSMLSKGFVWEPKRGIGGMKLAPNIVSSVTEVCVGVWGGQLL